MNENTLDLSARLLATENLKVVRASVSTASFDLKSRVLTLPMWRDITPNIEDMLVAHEVGHALYTGLEYLEPVEKQPILKSFLNVLEDVRIEKLIKQKYPGLRKRMSLGYQELNDRDFFKIKTIPLNHLNLIDRINLYYKAGITCGVTFNDTEMAFVRRASLTETLKDVIVLAKEIYDYAKETAKEDIQNSIDDFLSDHLGHREEADGEIDSDGESTEHSYNEDDFREESREIRNGSTQPSVDYSNYLEDLIENLIKSDTDKALAESLEEAADQDTRYQYHTITTDRFNPVVGYKKILKELNFDFTQDMSYNAPRYNLEDDETTKTREDNVRDELKKFMTGSTSAVNHMVKEFEMKKSADTYKRAQTSKTGSLDMSKVWSYKLNDDLFKSVTIVPDGKNHGMVFLLDWSGSMHDVINDTIKQVINLVMFCRKVQIPFRVYAFTTGYRNSSDEEYSAMRDYDNSLYDKSRETGESFIKPDKFNLLELYSNRMSNSEFNQMNSNLFDERVFWHPGYSLGGTPLNDALLWFYHNMDSFIKMNNIHKMNFITLTDGESQSVSCTTSLREFVWDPKANETIPVKHFVVCPVTKKTYKWSDSGVVQSRTLIDMIRDRWNVRIVGFFLIGNSMRHIRWALENNSAVHYDQIQNSVRPAFKKDGYYSIPGAPHDDLFLVPLNKTTIDDGELKATSDMTARNLSSSLMKFVGGKKTSRVLLSRFIELVA